MAFFPWKLLQAGPCAAAILLCGIGSSPVDGSETNTRPSSAKLVASTEPGWPQFRGPRRDGVSNERGLLPAWPEKGPELLWSTKGMGQGFSSPVISGDRIFLTGDVGEELHVIAMDLNGRRLWQTPNGKYWRDPYPGARASVAYSAGRVYHQNAHGRLACFEAENGREVWAVDLLERFRGKNITWALSECALVDERAVYATTGGGEALVVALDKKTGDVLWTSEPLIDTEGENVPESPSYVSPILVQFAGKRLIIGCSLKHLYCVDADTGKRQWIRRMPTSYSVLAMMPVLAGDSIFMTAPHGKPGGLFTLRAPVSPDAPVGVEETWTTRLDTCQGGAVQVDGKILGSFYSPRKGWAAVDAKSGEVLYSAPEIIKGAAIHADGRLYALSEDGWMNLLEAGASAFTSHGRFRLVDANRNDAWAHPVILDGRLYLRYHDTLYCYDIRKGGA